MLKPLVALALAGGLAWFGWTELQDGRVTLPGNVEVAVPVPVVSDQAVYIEGAVPADAVAAEDAADPAKRFSRALDGATEQARSLLRLGESKSRNLPDILSQQGKMGDRLAEIDALIASGELPAEAQPAIDAYRKGSDDIRNAMEKAQKGFTTFDFGKVRDATDQMRKGAESLAEARRLAGG